MEARTASVTARPELALHGLRSAPRGWLAQRKAAVQAADKAVAQERPQVQKELP